MNEHTYQKYLGMMCEKRYNRIYKKQNKADRVRSVAAEMLVRRAISSMCDIPEEDVVILEDEHGAPYIKGHDVYISISHSGEYAVCAVSDVPVGIDIEELRPASMRVARGTFSDAETEYLGCDNDEPDDAALGRFYEIWTAKEAYAKMKGTGIYLHNTIDTTTLTNVVREHIDGYIISIIEEKEA